ncbi:MAG: hypothetical protein IT379_14220, partial [Deltaproteobacteria bacterium]|nr:hypothetical protein [Deltaproteobacteria bacterium]
MEDRRPRERELVLAPNEYAYVLDVTKGHVNCYVGPNKTSLAQTDQPVLFDAETRRFVPVESREAVSLFATAPANWYLVLESPAKDGSHPPAGVASHLVELSIGRRVNVEGPASFALWPGQIARVIEGHRLRSNEYLYAQIHDAAAATAAGARTLGFAEGTRETAAFVTGQKLLIRGTDVAFYVPPTGVEVIPDEDGRHVREAVTLQRLEYCVLVGEDGRKRFVRGEAVVFPEPSERFLEQNGRRTLCAIELSETTGIHVKVIAPYVDEEGVAHVEGDELFLGGKDGLYFPREEHAFIVHGTEEVHHAVAIPAGEGRYVLDRRTGDIRLAKGPTMLLPDPRREVLTRRVLSERECELLYPGNAEVLA